MILITLKTIYFVFVLFNINLFAENRCSALNNCSFVLSNKYYVFDPLNWKVKSSANKMVKKSVDCAKSLMKNENNKGPRQLPWGIPQ